MSTSLTDFIMQEDTNVQGKIWGESCGLIRWYIEKCVNQNAENINRGWLCELRI